MEPPVAHSPRRKTGIEAQPYADHVGAVVVRAAANARAAAVFLNPPPPDFAEVVATASAWHDLGKLDDGKQAVLAKDERGSLPGVPHEEAGIRHLLAEGDLGSAALVAAHHRGLYDGAEVRKRITAKEPLPAFGIAEGLDQEWLVEWTPQLATRHLATCAPCPAPQKRFPFERGFDQRIALSCLVDADHGDTARNYRQEPDPEPVASRWSERLAALQRHVASLGNAGARAERRKEFFEACLAARLEPPLRACSAPVGSGKTLGVMAHLLQVAHARNLRRIFVVLPYTNIIAQSVAAYRTALALEGEDPESVIAELHHQADFSSLDLRHLAALWNAPVVVTTAVAFFETLAACKPGPRLTRPSGRVRIETRERRGDVPETAGLTRPSGRVRIETRRAASRRRRSRCLTRPSGRVRIET